jgi:hypothetical protein
VPRPFSGLSGAVAPRKCVANAEPSPAYTRDSDKKKMVSRRKGEPATEPLWATHPKFPASVVPTDSVGEKAGIGEGFYDVNVKGCKVRGNLEAARWKVMKGKTSGRKGGVSEDRRRRASDAGPRWLFDVRLGSRRCRSEGELAADKREG